jgi:hypothetical protein
VILNSKWSGDPEKSGLPERRRRGGGIEADPPVAGGASCCTANFIVVVDMHRDVIKLMMVPPTNSGDCRRGADVAVAPMLLSRRTALHHATLHILSGCRHAFSLLHK